LAVLLDRFRKSGRGVFLLTNSEYSYTNKVMSYLLDGANPNYASWRAYFGQLHSIFSYLLSLTKISLSFAFSFFFFFFLFFEIDVIIVGAQKPNFFGQGEALSVA
jgi:hypothetical protein